MAATKTGPQAAQYNRSSAVWTTLIKAFLHSTTISFPKGVKSLGLTKRNLTPPPPLQKKHAVVSNFPAVSRHSGNRVDAKQEALTHSPIEKIKSNIQYENRAVHISSYWHM